MAPRLRAPPAERFPKQSVRLQRMPPLGSAPAARSRTQRRSGGARRAVTSGQKQELRAQLRRVGPTMRTLLLWGANGQTRRQHLDPCSRPRQMCIRSDASFRRGGCAAQADVARSPVHWMASFRRYASLIKCTGGDTDACELVRRRSAQRVVHSPRKGSCAEVGARPWRTSASEPRRARQFLQDTGLRRRNRNAERPVCRVATTRVRVAQTERRKKTRVVRRKGGASCVASVPNSNTHDTYSYTSPRVRPESSKTVSGSTSRTE